MEIPHGLVETSESLHKALCLTVLGNESSVIYAEFSNLQTSVNPCERYGCQHA